MNGEQMKMQDGTQLDPKVVKVMRAIRTVESSGQKDPYSATGDGGDSHGAFQFNEKSGPGWKNLARDFLGNESAPMDRANQNKVAYHRIKQWKDEGKQPEEIAALWNGAKKVNGRYTYNQPEYGVKFRQALAGGVAQTQAQAIPSASQPAAPQQPNQGGFLGSDPHDSLYGRLLNNTITRGLTKAADSLTFGGASALGNETGAAIGQGIQYAKDAVTGSNVAPYMVGPDIGKEAIAAGKTVAGAGLLAGPGLLRSAMAREGGALGSNAIKNIIARDLGPKEALSSLGSMEKADILANVYKTASAGEKPLIEQALKELGPKILGENGIKEGLYKRIIRGMAKHPAEGFVGYQMMKPFVKKTVKGLYDKYIGDQIDGVNPNNTVTINPAP